MGNHLDRKDELWRFGVYLPTTQSSQLAVMTCKHTAEAVAV